MGAVLRATSKGSSSRLGCFQRLGGFLDDLCREGFLEQIIRFRYEHLEGLHLVKEPTAQENR